MVGSFHYLDEIAIADCAVDVSGRDLADLFETAALALADVTVDPATVALSVHRTLELEAPTLDLLLFEWLSELVFRKDRDSEVFVRTQVRVNESAPCRLVAELHGGPIVAPGTERRADVKGVTFHEFMIEATGGGWHARFILDL